MKKKCQKCSPLKTKKDGFRNGRQGYHCNDCGFVFQNKNRTTKASAKLWTEWADRKQTYTELTTDYSKNKYWVQEKLDMLYA